MDAAYIFALAKHRYAVNMKSFDDLILRKPAILRGNEKHFVSGFSEVFAEKISYPSAAATHRWKLVVQHQDYVIQPLIKEAVGKDIRAIVVGGKVIVAMRRIAPVGEFRSNIHRGGRGEIVALPDSYIDIAIRATAAMELEVAGVDLLETDNGPVVLEVNPSPGFEIEAVTGVPIAEPIIAFAVKYSQTHRRSTSDESLHS